MFFAPALLALTAPGLGNHVKILCLSTGDAEGLGSMRQKELLASSSLLGLREPPSDVFIIDSPSFPDSMSQPWSSSDISKVLSSAFVPQASSSLSKAKSTSTATMAKKANGVTSRKDIGREQEAPEATIDVLITFDGHGVSGHTNHVSLFDGAKAWLKAIMVGKAGWGYPVELYTLTSTNILRKYSSFLDAPITMLWGLLGEGFANVSRKKREKKVEGHRRLLFVNDLGQWRRGQQAMTQGHKSQMRWFRWGWIVAGRYMVVNDLKRERII